MAPNDREVNLIIRAQDLSSQPLSVVLDKIKQLTPALEAQTKLSLSGAANTAEYAKAFNDLGKAADALLKQKAALADFGLKEERLIDLTTKLAEKQQALDQFRSSIPAGDDRTAKQERQLKSFERAVTSAEKALSKGDEAYARALARLDRMGVDSFKTADAQKLLSAAILEVTSALSLASAADDKYGENKRRAASYIEFFTGALKEQDAAIAASAAAEARAAQERERAQAADDEAFRRRNQAAKQAEADRLARVEKEMADANKSRQNVQQFDLAKTFSAAEEEQKRAAAAAAAARKAEEADDAAFVQRQRAAQEEEAARLAASAKLMQQYNDSKHNIRQADLENVFRMSEAEKKAEEDRVAVAIKAHKAEVAAMQEAVQHEIELFKIQAAAEEKAAKDTTAISQFRDIGAEARQRAAELQAQVGASQAQLGQFGPGAATREAVASQMQGIPSRFGDLGEIQNADEAIAKLNERIDKGGVFASSYARNMNEVYSIQRKIAGDATLIDQFKNQEAATLAADQAWMKARTTVDQLAGEMSKTLAPTSEMRAQMAQARREMENAATAAQKENVALEKLRTQLKAAGIDENELDAITKKLIASAELLNTTQSRIQQKETGFLGLRPYQLKNLEYQIGDIYTQLSLGQGFLRTFNAQSDQIFQILDISTSKLRLLALYGAPAAAAIFVVVKALLEIKQAADTVREFNAQLTVNADGSLYNAKAMEQLAKAFEHAGTSAADARTGLEEMVKEGIAPERMAQVGKMAQDIVDVYGKKFPDALKEVTSGFTRGYDAIMKVNESYNFLTAAQAQRIKDLMDEGRVEEARALALDAFAAKLSDAAKNALGPFAEEVRNLKRAWDEFLISISNTGAIKALADMLRILGESARMLSGQLTLQNWKENVGRIYQGLDTLGADEEQMRALQQRRSQLMTDIGRAGQPQPVINPELGILQQVPGAQIDQTKVARLLDELLGVDKQIEQLRKDAEKNRALTGGGTSDASGRVTTGADSERTKSAAQQFIDELEKQYNEHRDRLQFGPERKAQDEAHVAEFKRQLTDKASQKGALTPESQAEINKLVQQEEDTLRRQREKAELASADRIRAINQQLADQLIAIRNKVAQADKTNVQARLQAFDEEWSKMQSVIDKAKAHGINNVQGQSLSDFQATLEAAREAERQQIVLDSAQAIVNNVIKERKDQYGKIMDEYRGGLIDINEAFKRSVEVTSQFAPKVAEAIKKARAAIAEVPSTPKTQAESAALDRTAATDTAGKDSRTGIINQGMSDLQKYFDTRRRIEQDEKALVLAGAVSKTEAEKSVQKVYDATKGKVVSLIDSLQDQIETAHNLHDIDDATYTDLVAKLKLAKTQTDYVSDSQKLLKKTIEDSIVNHAVQAFDTVAQSLGNLIAGTGKWKDVLSSVGLAFAQFAAGILRDVAAMIIKIELLTMIQNMMKTGSVAAAHGGDMVGPGMMMSRPVNPWVFAGAPRMHDGGPVTGLASDEVPAILQVGERVLSKSEARNYAAATGPKSGGGSSIRNVLAVGDKEIANAMSGAHGEKVVLNVLKRNAPTLRTWLRG